MIFDGAKQRVARKQSKPIYLLQRRHVNKDLCGYLPMPIGKEPDTTAVLESVRKSKFDRDGQHPKFRARMMSAPVDQFGAMGRGDF